ncbi:MAG TPA: cobalamin-independent methionine synthase II family protein [Dehalococcoidia bacterium]|nr:cobalamin-independent methionine synthase II family protein [Dehalococcoidia bacterium]
MAPAFRADHVGSLLRPPELLAARQDFAEQRIGAERLREIEDASVLKALDLQREAGIDVFTEGEYRRAAWSSAFRESVEGLAPDPDPPIRRLLGAWQGPHSDVANATVAAMPSLVASGKLRQVRRLAGAEAAFLKQHAPGPWKITTAGPLSVSGALYKSGVTDKAYATRAEFDNEVIGILRGELQTLIADGASYLQLDSLHYVERVADKTIRARMIAEGEDPDAYLETLIAADNAVLEGLRREGLTVGMHMCRGNNRSAWHAEGSYDAIAEQAFPRLNVDRFLLEYDTDRAGSFAPLRFVPRDRMVVLGLISSKEPALESIDDLRRRIDEAATYVPIERLAISPQCGFASTAAGNLLTWDEMRRKLELVAKTARAVWG